MIGLPGFVLQALDDTVNGIMNLAVSPKSTTLTWGGLQHESVGIQSMPDRLADSDLAHLHSNVLNWVTEIARPGLNKIARSQHHSCSRPLLFRACGTLWYTSSEDLTSPSVCVER